jgi:hypothetical protein
MRGKSNRPTLIGTSETAASCLRGSTEYLVPSDKEEGNEHRESFFLVLATGYCAYASCPAETGSGAFSAFVLVESNGR